METGEAFTLEAAAATAVIEEAFKMASRRLVSGELPFRDRLSQGLRLWESCSCFGVGFAGVGFCGRERSSLPVLRTAAATTEPNNL